MDRRPLHLHLAPLESSGNASIFQPVDDDADELERPTLELGGVVLGKPEDAGDHPHGKREGQPADKVDTTE